MSRRAGSVVIAFALLDLTAVGVQLPTLRADLGSSTSGGQWIMNAWLLALAVALPLARTVPRRRVVVAGALALAAGSIVCATAGSTATLVTGRAIAGAGVGALLAPITSAALVLPAFALALGPVIGGVVADHNWWHLWLWAGVPGAAVLGALALRDEPAEAPTAPSRADLLLLPALVGVTVLFVQNEPWGLVSRDVIELLGIASIALLATRLPTPERAGLVAVAGAVATFCLLLPQYFELAHLMQPLHSGVRLSLLTVALIAGVVLGRRFGAVSYRPWFGIAVAAVTLAGLVGLSAVDAHTGSAMLGAALVCAGAGLGLVAGAATPGRLDDLLGQATFAAALIVAATGAVFQQVQADERASLASFEAALSQSVGDAIGALILLIAVAGGVALVTARRASSAARPAAES